MELYKNMFYKDEKIGNYIINYNKLNLIEKLPSPGDELNKSTKRRKTLFTPFDEETRELEQMLIPVEPYPETRSVSASLHRITKVVEKLGPNYLSALGRTNDETPPKPTAPPLRIERDGLITGKTDLAYASGTSYSSAYEKPFTSQICLFDRFDPLDFFKATYQRMEKGLIRFKETFKKMYVVIRREFFPTKQDLAESYARAEKLAEETLQMIQQASIPDEQEERTKKMFEEYHQTLLPQETATGVNLQNEALPVDNAEIMKTPKRVLN